MLEKEQIRILSLGDENFKSHFVNPQRYMFQCGYTYPYAGLGFSMCWTSSIKNGEVGLLSQGERCRETFYGTLRRMLNAQKIAREFRNGKWEEIVGRDYLKGRELLEEANVLIPVGYPYPRLKEVRLKNEEMAKNFLDSARKVVLVLNNLEEIADWKERTEVLTARPTNMFPQGNSGSILFKLAPQWANMGYYLSLCLLICRFAINPFLREVDVKDAESLVSFCKDYKKQADRFAESCPWHLKRIVADMYHVYVSHPIWTGLMRSFNAAYGDKKRTDLLKGDPYAFSTRGVMALIANGPEGNYATELRNALKKNLNAVAKNVFVSAL